VAEIVTMAGGLRSGVSQDDPAVLRERDLGPLAVAIRDGDVASIGAEPQVMAELQGSGVAVDDMPRLDGVGGTVTPGLIDAHTHLLFGGTRQGELGARQRGAGYLEILAGGGGIHSTVEATRAASDDELLAHGRRWLAEILEHGVTTAEVKSGYGLDIANELRLLALYRQLGSESPVELVPTFLGAHAVPAEHRDRATGIDDYVTDVIERQLPAAASQGIARFCDVFCEPGVFDVRQTRRILAAARALGLPARLHADELHDSSGAALAAELGATSADHLAAVSEDGIQALGRAADEGRPVVATLLPATTLYLMRERHAPARKLIDRGVPVALGTDFNPGTSPTASLPLVMSLACILLHMTAAEALAAVTINAAHAVALGDTHGALAAGKVGDVLIWSVPRHELIPHWIGANLVQAVVKRGHVVSVKPRAGA